MNNSREDIYLSQLSEAIKAYDATLSDLFNFEIIALLNYDKSNYAHLRDLLLEKKFDEAKIKFSSVPKTPEDLTIVSFQANGGMTKLAVIYDSDELWQDAKVIELLPY